MKKSILFYFIFPLILEVAVTGCGPSAQQQRQTWVNTHQGFSDEIKSAVLAGEVRIGMPIEAVEASWGKPRRTHVHVPKGIMICIYSNGYYLYFKPNPEYGWELYKIDTM